MEELATLGQADRQWAFSVGAQRPQQAWILSDRDVWYQNPSYRGPDVPHPESYQDLDDIEADIGNPTETACNDSIVLVEEGQMVEFQRRLDALNKKALSFGLERIRIVDVTDVLYERKFEYTGRDMDRQLSYLVPVREGKRTEHPVRLKRVEIQYPEVKLGNWRVVGKIEEVEGGNLTFAISRDASDVMTLNAMGNTTIKCEHCKTSRYRKGSYLLRENDSGDYMQVGGNCIKDFTGIDPAAALFLARMSTIVTIAEADLDDFARSGRINAVNTREYLADVSFITDNYGFVSAAKAREQGLSATYYEAIGLCRDLQNDKVKREKYLEQRERHLAKADSIRQWIAEKPGDSSFDHNVKLLLKADAIAIEPKHLAFAAAAVPMYNRALEENAPAHKASVHVGTPGQKMVAMLFVDRILQIDSYYGTSNLVLMHDKEGNKLKWKTSACPDEILNHGLGCSMEVSFKVKEHDDYKGIAQTAITHLKFVRWLEQQDI